MAWVSCLLIDAADGDPRFGVTAAQLLDRPLPHRRFLPFQCSLDQVVSGGSPNERESS